MKSTRAPQRSASRRRRPGMLARRTWTTTRSRRCFRRTHASDRRGVRDGDAVPARADRWGRSRPWRKPRARLCWPVRNACRGCGSPALAARCDRRRNRRSAACSPCEQGIRRRRAIRCCRAGAWRSARRRRLQRQPSRSRTVRRGRCRGGRSRGRHHSNCRLSSRPACRAMHAARPARCDAFHGRVGVAQGIRPLGRFRNGQVRAAWSRAEHAHELAPQGIHVAHVVVDGAIRPVGAPDDGQDALLDPDAIAATYVHMLAQPRSVWSWCIEVRPWVECF